MSARVTRGGAAPAQLGVERRGQLADAAEQAAAGIAAMLLERLEDLRLLLQPHAAHPADAAVVRRLLELVERPTRSSP